ncbi:hypothetical protein Pcinc_018082 [Petrolisthes cinctipes]|uniref:Uncharacterized protein n=1 Tax=Petrolisthes cinctipes TaxID=88211 RepID=A0AAE1FNV7_PETCI|nr:hypothetical protein Pcinc_018082 [Petrolisthes cinctipes]
MRQPPQQPHSPRRPPPMQETPPRRPPAPSLPLLTLAPATPTAHARVTLRDSSATRPLEEGGGVGVSVRRLLCGV